MSVMKRDQDYSVYKKEAVKEVTFFTNALAVDGFDMSIQHVSADENGSHAKVELRWWPGWLPRVSRT
jgi:hypothetical protein